MRYRFAILAVAVLLVFSECGFAQFSSALILQERERETYGVPGEYRNLLRIDAVRQELSIKPEQLEKLNDVLEKLPPVSESNDLQSRMKKLETSFQEVLSPSQWKRCVELRLQNAGSAALVRNDIATELKQSEAQRAELAKLREKAISDAVTAGFRLGFRSDGSSPEVLKQHAAERKLREEQSLKRGLEILTDDQRDQFQKLRGELFAFPELSE
ncbi:MAG: hypothetical protein R3C01_17515 [Planctomycetaceae bacterium]